MREPLTRNPASTAHINGHPLHPLLVTVPIGFFIAVLVCDIAYWATAEPGWADAALWLLGIGLLAAIAAAVAGTMDFTGDARIRELSDAWQHAIGNIVMVLVEAVNFYARLAYGEGAILPIGIILSLIAVVILGFTGWKGGEMVFHHRVAVQDPLDEKR